MSEQYFLKLPVDEADALITVSMQYLAHKREMEDHDVKSLQSKQGMK